MRQEGTIHLPGTDIDGLPCILLRETIHGVTVEIKLESLPTNAKLTDEAIKLKAIEEFGDLKPHNPKDLTLAKALTDGVYHISRFRWRYNQGRYTNGKIPKPKSRQYN